MNNTELLKKLQEVLEIEYTDIFTYNNESELFKLKLKDGEKIANVYKKFVLDELVHADIISQHISLLGGKPVWEYKNIFVSKSIRESLKVHLEREIKSYHSYTELINLVDDRKFKTELKGIRENEKEHIEKITKILKSLTSK